MHFSLRPAEDVVTVTSIHGGKDALVTLALRFRNVSAEVMHVRADESKVIRVHTGE
jgi:hypothetical protein